MKNNNGTFAIVNTQEIEINQQLNLYAKTSTAELHSLLAAFKLIKSLNSMKFVVFSSCLEAICTTNSNHPKNEMAVLIHELYYDLTQSGKHNFIVNHALRGRH